MYDNPRETYLAKDRCKIFPRDRNLKVEKKKENTAKVDYSKY